MTNICIKGVTYELYPNKTMKKVLDRNCDYRRYCWNQALALWNDLYDAYTILHTNDLNPKPNWRLVRNQLVREKADWQYYYSSRILQLAVQDLGNAWQKYFTKTQPDWNKPKFKTKRDLKQGFKSDAARIVSGKLVLDKPLILKQKWSAIKLSEPPLDYPTGVMSFYRIRDHYFVAISYKIPKNDIKAKAKTGKVTGVDANVGHFNYFAGVKYILPPKLQHNYQRIKYYQRMLARKREVNGKKQALNSKKYLQTKTKLQAAYQKITNIQNDLMQKFTTELVTDYDAIVIEDLDVKHMLMSHVASKGMQKSMFGKFRQILTYKCDWYDRKLIIANKRYPSTQRCAVCGTVKKGDERITLRGNKKHHTKHNEFICYNPACPNYNQKVDRDENAMLNLTLLVKHPELNKEL